MRKPRTKTRECPECGQFFSPQGLSGHLRMQHKLAREEAKQVLAAFADPGPSVIDAIDDPAKTPSGFPPATIAGIGILVAGVILASVVHRQTMVGCANCGTAMDVSAARAEGLELVSCPTCHAVIGLPR